MALKVYDLQCEHGHVFEGWFGSDDNYESQRERGLLSCPVCDSREVNKKLSAPRLNVSHIRAVQESGQGEASVAAPGAAQMAQLQAEVMRHIRQMVRNTENVGDRFVQEARRMHEGEIEERAIRGTATAQEREELLSEGITVMPIPDFLDDERLQ
jgi:hypothetical protein